MADGTGKSTTTDSPSTSNGDKILLTESQLKTLDDFYVLNEIGEGSFSNVFLASTKSNHMRCALKVCSKLRIQREKKVKQVFRERDNLRLLSTKENARPFIVQLYATFQDVESLYFALSYAKHRDIAERMNKTAFDVETSRFVTAEIVTALEYIHSHRILHRDVKPENILVKEDFHIMLSDFGCSINLNECDSKEKPQGSRKCSFVGSSLYVCPEVLHGEAVDETCDYFSLGSILFEMLVGKAPFHDASEHLVFQRIVRNKYSFPDNFPDEDAKDLVRRLLDPKQEKRLGSPATGGSRPVKAHVFFTQTKWDTIITDPSPLAHYYNKSPVAADNNRGNNNAAASNSDSLENW